MCEVLVLIIWRDVHGHEREFDPDPTCTLTLHSESWKETNNRNTNTSNAQGLLTNSSHAPFYGPDTTLCLVIKYI